MVTEQDKTLDALKTAIQMEIDGKQYYLKASRESSNELGKKLLHSLAEIEDIHRQKFEEIFNAIRDKKAWPVIAVQPERSQKLRTIFAQATKEIGSNIKVPATELDAVQITMDMENKTYDFYKNQHKIAAYDAEREYYQKLSAEYHHSGFY